MVLSKPHSLQWTDSSCFSVQHNRKNKMKYLLDDNLNFSFVVVVVHSYRSVFRQSFVFSLSCTQTRRAETIHILDSFQRKRALHKKHTSF
jgi:hypothetical protein